MESKKAYGFLFQISTKANKKELAICSDPQKLDFFCSAPIKLDHWELSRFA